MRRRAEQTWKEFAAWCRQRGLKALPAHPWTVAAFARWRESRATALQIARDVRTIARVHLLASLPPPDRHPTVRRTLRVIAARQSARRQGAALFRDDDFATDEDRQRPGPVSSEADDRKAPSRRRTLRNQPNLVARRPGGTKRRD